MFFTFVPSMIVKEFRCIPSQGLILHVHHAESRRSVVEVVCRSSSLETKTMVKVK